MTSRSSKQEPDSAGGLEGIEDVVDELLAIPPQEFTAARNAAVKRLRAEGRREAADEVKQLARPPLALWAANRLAHSKPALIEKFLNASEKLREAHRGGGDIRAATLPQREAEARVVTAAADVAGAEGANVTETFTRGLRDILSAAATDEGVAAELRAGRLLREPEAPTLDELLATLPQQSPSKHDSGRERRALQEQIADAKAQLSQAREEARAAQDAERAARQGWEQAQKLADGAQRRSEAAEAQLQKLQARLDDL